MNENEQNFKEYNAIIHRLNELKIDKPEISRAQIQAATGVSASAVQQWYTRGKVKLENLKKIAELYGVSYRWLATGEGSREEGAEGEPPEGYCAVPLSSLEFAAGDGIEAPAWIEDGSAAPVYYRLDYLHALGGVPALCRRVKVAGDSMQPTINDGDTVLIEAQRETMPGAAPVIDGAIYAISIGQALRIKRLAKIKGGYLVTSDNELYPSETYTGEDLKDFRIYGRALELTRQLSKRS